MLPEPIRQAIETHARWAFPQEACGLIASDGDGDLRMAYCLTNIEQDPNRYTVDPAEHFAAQRHAERNGWPSPPDQDSCMAKPVPQPPSPMLG